MSPKPTEAMKKRKNIRFSPEQCQVAFLQFAGLQPKKFKSEMVALIIEESAGGCGLVIIGNSSDFYTTQLCLVQVGQLAPIKAEVRWVKAVDAKVITLGLKYLDL